MLNFSEEYNTSWSIFAQKRHEIEMTVFGLKKAIELNEKSILQVSLDIDKKKNEVTLELKNEHPEHRAQVEDQLFYY